MHIWCGIFTGETMYPWFYFAKSKTALGPLLAYFLELWRDEYQIEAQSMKEYLRDVLKRLLQTQNVSLNFHASLLVHF